MRKIEKAAGRFTGSVDGTGIMPAFTTECTHENAAIQNSVAADYYYPGAELWKCPDCNETWTVEIPATGEHEWNGSDAKEPTCTEPGYKEHTCTVCGKIKHEEVEALGHDFEDGVCSVCGESDPDYIPEQPEQPEQPEEPSVPATPVKPAFNNWIANAIRNIQNMMKNMFNWNWGWKK